MKFRINYKSKKTIIAVIALIALFAVAFAGGYAWVKSNDQSTAVTDENVNDGAQNASEDGNNQVSLPDLGDDEENNSSENNNGEDNSSETTNNNTTNSNNSSTGTTATEDATTVIEQVVVGEKLVAEDTKMKWYPEEVEVPETSLDLLKSKLTVVKKAETLTGSNLVQAGETVNYTIEVTNNGAEALNKIEVSDIIPAGTTFKSVEDNTAVLVKKTTETEEEVVTKIIWTIDIDAGKTVAVKFAVTVNEDAKGTITNVAIANGDKSQEQQLAVIKADKTAVINNNPNLTEAKMGDEITYTISIENTSEEVTGTVLVKDSDLADILREELDVENIIEKAELVGAIKVNGVETEYTAEDLIAGINVPVEEDEIATVVFTVKIKVIEGEISNAALIGNGKPTEPEKTNTVNITATKKNDKNNAVVKVGDEINYTIELSNSGNVAGTTTVTDTLPAELEFVSASVTPSKTETVNGTTVLTWNNVSVAGNNGTTTITVNTEVKSVSSTKIYNNITVEGKTTTDEGVDTINITIEKDNNDPDGKVKVRDPLQYTITLTNSGNTTGTTTVTDILPAELEFVSSSRKTTSVVEQTDGTTLITWENVSVIGNNGTTTITVNTRVKSVSDEKIVNTATAEGKTDTDDGVDTVNITAIKENKDTDGKVKVGDTLQYEITLTNSGTVTGTTKVVDILPAGLKFVSATVTPTSTAQQEDGTTKLTWEDVEVLATETTIIAVNTTVEAVSDEKILNSVTVEGTTTTDSGVDTVNITAVKKHNDTDGFVKVGDEINYTIELSNSGSVAGTTTVTDTLPEGVTFVEVSEGGVYSNGKVIWEDVEVTPGTSTVTLIVKVTVNENVTGRITNKVEAEGKETTDEGLDTVNITATKVNNDDDGKVEIGDALSYTITLTNTGSKSGTTTIADILPIELEYNANGTSPAPNYVTTQADGTTLLLWNDVNVLTETPIVITVSTTVKSGTGHKVANTIILEGKEYSDDGVDIVGIIPHKSVDKTHAEYGEILTYTIKATSQAIHEQDLVIEDTIDTEKVEFVPGSITVDGETQPDNLYNNGTIKYTSTIEGIGKEVVLQFKVKVNSIHVGALITNTAKVNEKETEKVTTKITKVVTVQYDALTERPLNVILVLDTSNSMANDNKITNLKKEAKNIVDILFPEAIDTGSTVSLIEFSDDANIIGTYHGSQKATLSGNIDALKTHGGTNEYAALDKTLQLLNQKDQSGANVLDNPVKLVIFLSDGAATTGTNYNANSAGGLINENNSSGYENNTRQNIINKAAQIKAIHGVTLYTIGFGMDELATNNIAWAEYCNDVDNTAVNPISVTGTSVTSENNVTFTITVINSSEEDIVVPTVTAYLRGVNRESVVAINGTVYGWDNIRAIWENITVPAEESIELTATATKATGGGNKQEVSIDATHDYSVATVCTNTEHVGIPFTGITTKNGKVYHYMNTKDWGTYTLEKIATSAATYEKIENSSDIEALSKIFEDIVRKEISGTKTAYADSLPVVIDIDEPHRIVGNVTVTIGSDSNTYTIEELTEGVNGLVYTPEVGFIWTINDEAMLYEKLLLKYAHAARYT